METEKTRALGPIRPKWNSSVGSWVGGIGFTFFIALLGYWLAKIPGFNHVGQLASAIVIAVVYRQLIGYPKTIRSGIGFSTKKLLRFAIILFGLKLNIATGNQFEFPWFLIGFILMSILGKYLIGNQIPVSEGVMSGISTLTSWCLTSAMVGLGLNVNLRDLRKKALRPLIVIVIVSISLSIFAYLIV